MASIEGNRKIAKHRGDQWKQNLVTGRLDAELHPTKIKLGRLRKLISQTKLAQNLGISLATYGAIERGRRPALTKTAKKISTVLKINLKDLFRMKDGKYLALK